MKNITQSIVNFSDIDRDPMSCGKITPSLTIPTPMTSATTTYPKKIKKRDEKEANKRKSEDMDEPKDSEIPLEIEITDKNDSSNFSIESSVSLNVPKKTSKEKKVS